jgi:hypothetical protein
MLAFETIEPPLHFMPDPCRDETGEALMIPPSLQVLEITREFVVIRDPVRCATLQLSRPIYEMFRRFVRPCWVKDVLPGESPRRERALACIRQLEQKGFLAAPATMISPFRHEVP